MTRSVRRLAGATLALAATAGLGALSWVPYTADPRDHGVIKLAWRARGEQVRTCRRLTEEELERLPAHMREDEACSRRFLPYRLRLALDGDTVANQLVQAGGARHDRPLYVSLAIPAAPGAHAVHLSFGLEEAHGGEVTPDEAAFHQPAVLDTTLEVVARRVALITYDEQARHFIVLTAADAR